MLDFLSSYNLVGGTVNNKSSKFKRNKTDNSKHLLARSSSMLRGYLPCVTICGQTLLLQHALCSKVLSIGRIFGFYTSSSFL